MPGALQTIKNFRQASPEVATSGQPAREHFTAMATAGYVSVINLALHDDPRYSLPDEAGDVRAAGMQYVHIPVQFAHPMTSQLDAYMDVMDSYSGRKGVGALRGEYAGDGVSRAISGIATRLGTRPCI